MILSDVNQLINAHDRYNECLKRVGVIGVPNVISISTSEKLRDLAKATGKQVRRSKDASGNVRFKVIYRGVHFICSKPELIVAHDELCTDIEQDPAA